MLGIGRRGRRMKDERWVGFWSRKEKGKGKKHWSPG